jgi:hypothetical protein
MMGYSVSCERFEVAVFPQKGPGPFTLRVHDAVNCNGTFEGTLPVEKARELAAYILRICDELDPPAKVEHIED